MKQPIHGLGPEQLAEAVREAGGERFRARQLAEWLWTRFAASWDEMANLPRALRAALAERWLDLDGALATEEVAGEEGTGTRKILSRLADGELVETVLIPAAKGRTTVCVSSQVGCGCGCAFCASGLNGCTRSLSAGEIAAQAARAARLLGRRPDNVVFMGIGEPFLNYDAALAAARRMNDPAPDGLGIGARRITVSTCGVVPGIERFAGEGRQFELSVSLHAPTDEQRAALMPVDRKWPIGVLVPACRAYTEKTGRIVTFEYTLVAGFNDRPEDARALLALLKPFPCRVNLIPLNPVKEFSGRTPSAAACEAFRSSLERGGLNATLRRSKGRGVNASCGQLRRSRIVPCVAAFAACLVAGCGGRAPDAAAERRATASLPPVAEIVRTIGGERWETGCLVGPGQDPHVYEPTPGQVSALASSRLFFRTEMPFEETLAARVASAFPAVKTVALEPAVPRGGGAAGARGHDEAALHGWLSPANLEAWARAVADELSAADPADAGAVEARLAAWLDELDAETARTRAAVSGAGVRAFAAWHPAYGAWAEAFGLEQIALEADGKAPGPRTLAAARARVAETGATVLLVQNGAEAARAAAFARGAGLRVAVVPPLGDDPVATLRALREAVAGASPAPPGG